jgi:hypothetical protein
VTFTVSLCEAGPRHVEADLLAGQELDFVELDGCETGEGAR